TYFAEIHVSHDLWRVDGVHDPHRDRRIHQPGQPELPGGADNRGVQGDARRPVLHAHQIREQPDEADRRHRVLLSGDHADADDVRLPVARMVYGAARINGGRRDSQPDVAAHGWRSAPLGDASAVITEVA